MIVEAAIKRGIRHIDGAADYGNEKEGTQYVSQLCILVVRLFHSCVNDLSLICLDSGRGHQEVH